MRRYTAAIYSVIRTNKFKKDVELLSKQGKNLEKLFDIVVQLSDGLVLDEKYKDHNLKGKYIGFRECHIEPDWILIYQIKENDLVLEITRTGSHAKLFLLLF